VDLDRDLYVDTVYATDYHGQLWKFDLSSNNSASWAVGRGGLPLFEATDRVAGEQISTGGLDAVSHYIRGTVVQFGTGRYLIDGDNVVPADPQIQTFYGIWDDPD